MPEERVKGPAIAMIVTAILGIFWSIVSTIMNTVNLATGSEQGSAVTEMYQKIGVPLTYEMIIMFSLIFGVVGILTALIILFGAIRMRALKSYGLAMTSSILIMIPFISPCCVLGLPFGIWSLVVLGDDQVRKAFK